MVSDLHGYDLRSGRHPLRINRKRYTRGTKTHRRHGNGWKVACNGNLKGSMYYEHSW